MPGNFVLNSCRYIGIIALSWPLSACLSWFRPEPSKSKQYNVAQPPRPWQAADGGGADRAYLNPDDKASMSINSVCHQYQNLSLKDLTKQLFVGIGTYDVVSERNIVVNAMPGLESQVTGMMDGRTFEGIYTVLRSIDCVYDVLLVTTPGRITQHATVYHKVVQSLEETRQP